VKFIRLKIHEVCGGTGIFIKVLPIFLVFWSVSCLTKEKQDKTPTRYLWNKPAHFPDPVYRLSKNPLTLEGITLGKTLFYEPLLSGSNRISCGSCHQQKSAFSHQGKDFSLGIHGQPGRRNAPAIQNMAWNPSFFWDGGVHDLDFVPFNPVQDPKEMGEQINHVILKLNSKKEGMGMETYPALFEAAFGTKEISTENMMKALSQFMVTLVSAGSRYDTYVAGDSSALHVQEKEGLVLFRQKCAGCHAGELFTDYTFRNNGLPALRANDQGRFDVTRLDADKHKFKVPGLRNVVYTAPYMHDGRFKTLKAVLDHYTGGVVKSKTLDTLLIKKKGNSGITLTDSEKKKLLAFLGSLTDPQFLSDTTFADPHVSLISEHKEK
jgi:cytochrome c peroxidase